MSDENSSSTAPCITTEFLQKALRTGEDDPSLVVTRADITSATARGDNLLGLLFRASLNVEPGNDDSPEERSLIVKCLPKEGILETYIREASLFPIEIEMYQKTLPEMYKILREKYWDTSRTYSAKFFYSTPEADVIVMEDLASKGFKIAMREQGFDLEHCNLIMKSLAVFHAASVPLVENDPSSVSLFREGIFKECSREFLETYFVSSIRALVNELQNWPEFKERYTDKLNDMIDTCWDKISEAVAHDENTFNVLNHGDLWVNNAMFRYSQGGKVEELRFIDFQNVHYTSPAVDLLYFMHTSPSDEVRAQHYDALVGTYHETLCNTMKSLGCGEKAPTLAYLREEMKRRATIALFAVVCELPNILARSDEIYNIGQYFTEDDDQKPKENHAYAGAAYKKTVQRLLPLFENQGIL